MDHTTSARPELLESLFNHIVLPPRLPGRHDSNRTNIEHAFIDRFINASRAMRSVAADGPHRAAWDSICRSLHTSRTCNPGGKLDKTSLCREFRNLTDRETLILHLSEQNCGLLLRRCGENIIFEAFEVSPLSADVLASQNALLRTFPGTTVILERSIFCDDSFQEQLSTFLQQASIESIKRFAAKTHKAGSLAFESRDTADPALITSMLMTLLEANGRRVYPPLLQKRIHDDVCWADGADRPWRRSEFWLVLRVAIQRELSVLLGGEVGRTHYKFVMCVLLAGLLDDTLTTLDPASVHLIKAKLCRRLVKLEVNKDQASLDLRPVYQSLFESLTTRFEKSVQDATRYIEIRWEEMKKSTRRPVYPLPKKADPRDLVLKLPNSRAYLDRVMKEASRPTHTQSYDHDQSRNDFQAMLASKGHFKAFSERYFDLVDLEVEIRTSIGQASESLCLTTLQNDSLDLGEMQCIKLANLIEKYIAAVGAAYDEYADQKGEMLLTIMELWVAMDKCATKTYPLMTEYHPGFPSAMMDVLHLPHLSQLKRLKDVQAYLEVRKLRSGDSHATIFGDPSEECFGVRYYKDCPMLHRLHDYIEEDAQKAREQKEVEWNALSAEYESMVRQISEASCIFKISEETSERYHDTRNCTKCFLERKAWRHRIKIYEHPLPADLNATKAVVFELGIPEAFARYRNSTFTIIAKLTRSETTEKIQPPRVLLCDYAPLKTYKTTAVHAWGTTLASSAKAFLDTHYSHVRFPVSLDNVCLPSGLKFRMYDSRHGIWPDKQYQRPTLCHHFELKLPTGSPFAHLQSSPDFAADHYGPTSNQIIASQSMCPPGANSHEYMAFQSLSSGYNRRWLVLLMELGSTNLNFSTEASSCMVSAVALQAGPEAGNDVLRAAHRVFRDDSFCEELVTQLSSRLSGLKANWREVFLMDMLITLMLRLWTLSVNHHFSAKALDLLAHARIITSEWISALRKEASIAVDAETSQRITSYAMWAALLCKRTFIVFADQSMLLDPMSTRCFIESSITIQDNLVGGLGTLASTQRHRLVSDLIMTYKMRHILRQSIEHNQGSLRMAIHTFWPVLDAGVSQPPVACAFLQPPYEWVLELVMSATHQMSQQVVHYALLYGTLGVNGFPLGKLPIQYRTHPLLKLLFGTQNLLVFNSPLVGMSHGIVLHLPYNHQAHIGLRDNQLVVRACVNGAILEYVPREVFGNPANFDLPSSLVIDRFHWLNPRSGLLEIRQGPEPWKSRESDWVLNLNTRQARRRNVTLVDPHSPLFQSIARQFTYFEYRHHLTVFQPLWRNLTVDLRRMELSFTVNRRNLLECSQLQSEIDPNQDAGTWYGLNSKIVLRSTLNPRQRSIIVPKGTLTCRKSNAHVAVDVANVVGQYGTFTINSVLGRLDCAAEPTLLYSKALFHAYTSFVLPDPLTGRIGTEESIKYLKSGSFQPWEPLSIHSYNILKDIAKLSPRREYYPEDLRYMQTVVSNPSSSINIERPEFRHLVESIIKRSEELRTFAPQHASLPGLEPSGDPGLAQRSYIRHHRYCRSFLEEKPQATVADVEYTARDSCPRSHGRSKVFRCASIVRSWPNTIRTTKDLAGILQQWPIIGGYNGNFDKVVISDLLSLDMSREWGRLVKLCQGSEAKDRYSLMFLFSLLGFGKDVNMDAVRTLIAFAVSNDLKSLTPPQWPSYNHFRKDQHPRSDHLIQLMKPCREAYTNEVKDALGSTLSYKQRKKYELEEMQHETLVRKQCESFADFLLAQWPCVEPSLTGFSLDILLDCEMAMAAIKPEWFRWFQNIQLSAHVFQAQAILDRMQVDIEVELPRGSSKTQAVLPTRNRGGEVPTLLDLISKRGPRILAGVIPSAIGKTHVGGTLNELPNGARRSLSKESEKPSLAVAATPALMSTKELDRVISTMTGSQSLVRQQYGRDLEASLVALKGLSPAMSNQTILNPAQLSSDITNADKIAQGLIAEIRQALEAHDSRAKWLRVGGLAPCDTRISLLELLRSTAHAEFGKGMKEALVRYAVSLTRLQRLLRLQDALSKGHKQRFTEERNNGGHANWQPLERTDWLLLEIESDILIRPRQVDTSVILPMVAAVLADATQLSRIIVPRSLLLQTAQIFQARLGGLLGRKICHIPFSRKTQANSDTLKKYYSIHQEALKKCSIILGLPEHLMSFRLSGLQRVSDDRLAEAGWMVNIQRWLSKVSRDVLDECDITLAVRTQLIYPSGSQSAVDGNPYRWQTAEAILRLVDSNLTALRYRFPQSIEVVRRPSGGYPFIYLLRRDVEDALIEQLVKEICSGRTSVLPAANECSKDDRSAIKHFISEAKVCDDIIKRVHGMFPGKPACLQILRLLRGLFVHRILLLTLKKRWNVQYGLNPLRDPIAVPYHAKGVPSAQSEWGHPDVSILFTCLSFYYDGLTLPQIHQSLEHVLKGDDPATEYERWATENLPGSLRDWNAINVDDEAQLAEIHRHVRYNVNVIDHYLNNFVFPKHAKQFKIKLSASAWDIPLFSPQNNVNLAKSSSKEVRKALTTGFSGTNDSRNMLPLNIKQEDLSGLWHTNAEVLTFMLAPRSRTFVLTADHRGRRLSEVEILRRLAKTKIRVLIDAGAQILEHDNLSLVKAWLVEDHESTAAVYFDTDNKAWVLYRHGYRVPLLASPFADNLEECLVYLDEAHTRGTDLKLPTDAIGALTLGLNVTKDTLSQAAMRLRQLGTTQSVVFFAPPEVHQSILDLVKKKHNDPVDSYDVVRWVLEQTVTGIEQLQPLYFAQGIDFCRRTQAALDNPDFMEDTCERDAYLAVLQQKERQTLKTLYEPKSSKAALDVTTYCPSLAAFKERLDAQRRSFKDTGHAVHGSALEEVEVEREVEVAYEVEDVREVQRPTQLMPLSFGGLHRDLTRFVQTGRLSAGSAAFQNAFAALRRTVAGAKYGIDAERMSSKLYVSVEFTRTVSLYRSDDTFQRPVNFILWSSVTEDYMIISPEECEICIALIRDMAESPTHLLTYAAPVTRKMLRFNDLRYYAIPELPRGWNAPIWLKMELGIFAGRLYFEWDEHSSVLQPLGVAVDEEDEKPENSYTHLTSLEIPDGDTEDQDLGPNEQQEGQKCFSTNPLAFLHEWLTVRRKGQDFEHTPLGHIVQGKRLTPTHSFFQVATDASRGQKPVPSNSKHVRGTGKDRMNGYDSEDADDYLDDEFFDAEEDHDADFGDEENGFDETGEVGGAFFNGDEEYVEAGMTP
ncbi:uncharacterized protein BDZ99DRAFT_428253 [Mytilinidion resinicola]|uniref:ubiquitinyl hydrolase 1 n=1 Tax=Mytilinidion resinicola TaxID=574789 RepID=A0A6A6Y2S1_9PEZI|nr:uncharacterized protein BDZ99DRAFT_428253 [Mytilinidion resinicola]KAF2802818.1 hypothetical protein BDZ99DRAFT_428253 [Mytilinidion resinicola]